MKTMLSIIGGITLALIAIQLIRYSLTSSEYKVKAFINLSLDDAYKNHLKYNFHGALNRYFDAIYATSRLGGDLDQTSITILEEVSTEINKILCFYYQCDLESILKNRKPFPEIFEKIIQKIPDAYDDYVTELYLLYDNLLTISHWDTISRK